MSDEPEEGEVAKGHWWARFDKALANEDANLVLSLIAIFIVFFAYETDLLDTNPFGWWLLAILDLLLVTWFIAEHARSISLADDRSAWWRAHWWEMIGLAPLMLGAVTPLSSVAVLRVIRLSRVFTAVMRLLGLHQTHVRSPFHRRVQHLFFVIFCLITTGGGMTYFFEKRGYERCIADPVCDSSDYITSLSDAMWWAVTTTTTVGYGDFIPQSTGGRTVAILLMFVGIGIFGVLAGSLSQVFLAYRDKAATTEIANPKKGGELVSDLDKLAELRKDGLLSSAEFEEAKGQLLDRSSTLDDHALEYTPRGSSWRIEGDNGEKLTQAEREERIAEARSALRNNGEDGSGE